MRPFFSQETAGQDDAHHHHHSTRKRQEKRIIQTEVKEQKTQKRFQIAKVSKFLVSFLIDVQLSISHSKVELTSQSQRKLFTIKPVLFQLLFCVYDSTVCLVGIPSILMFFNCSRCMFPILIFATEYARCFLMTITFVFLMLNS